MICGPNWREYMIWFASFYLIFRRWTIVQLEKHKGQGEFIQSYLRTELAVTLHAAECYADNYTAWSHRAWLVDRFMYDKKKVIWIHSRLTHKLLNPSNYPEEWSASNFSLQNQWFVKQSGHENYRRDHIGWICLIFNQLLPTTSVENE